MLPSTESGPGFGCTSPHNKIRQVTHSESVVRTFVRFVLVWICRFPLPLGVWGAAVCDCGTPWAFLLPFLTQAVERMNRTKMWKPQYATCLRLPRPIVFDIPEKPPEPSDFSLHTNKYYNVGIEERSGAVQTAGPGYKNYFQSS